MLTRYLGNKTTLIEPILEEIQRCVPPNTSGVRRARVGDLFAGTMSVSLALKRAGYNVVAGDVQAFSGIVGEAFLVATSIPAVPSNLVPPGGGSVASRALLGVPGFRFLNDRKLASDYVRLLDVFEHLEGLEPSRQPEDWRRSHVFDTYTEGGRNSAFRTSRGATGRRRFFTPENGHRIDVALNQIRYWWKTKAISRDLYTLLVSALLRAVEKVSNTQGTYHDFPRDAYDARSLKPLRFQPPPMDDVLCGGQHSMHVGDSLETVRNMPEMDVLYLDPPYNFRQYTSYYFLPNLLARYGDMSDDELEAWFADVEFARGQNMVDDFSSTFCRKNRFLDDLGVLIDRASPRWVVLSYFDGRNHWNDFKKDANGIGLRLLSEFFEGDRFRPGAQLRPVKRTNYQSYGGYTARQITEFLFVGELDRCHSSQTDSNSVVSSGAAFSAAFSP